MMGFIDDIVKVFKALYPSLEEKNEQLRKQLKKIEIISIVSVVLIECIVIRLFFFWMPGLIYSVRDMWRLAPGSVLILGICLLAIDVFCIVPPIVVAIYKSKTRDLRQKKSFYRKCISNGLKECNTEMEKEKATLIAKQIGIKKISDISRYFYEAKKIVETENLEKTETTQKTKLEEQRKQEEALCNQLNKYSSYYGREKRIAMLKDERCEVLARIKEKQNLVNGVNNVFFEKEHDPYLHGGIASGIAGTGAGVVRALEVQQKNADIRERNAQNTKLLGPSLYKMKEEISHDKTYARQLLESVNDVEIKLVLEEPPATCFEKLTFKNTRVEISECGSCVVTVDVEMLEPMRILDNLNGIIDGTVIAEIYDSNKCIGKANMVLPKYGIKYGDKIELMGMALFCGETDKNYTVKFCPSENLWAMEK